jgi:16S rRNA (guanine527-N7)-methyltransferase
MDVSRIAALLRPFLQEEALNATQLNQISTYIDLLLRWNARINLTAIRTPEEIVTRHFGESLFAARHLTCEADACGVDTPGRQNTSQVPQVRVRSLDANLGNNTATTSARSAPTTRQLVDVGSGAGFPGLPIKIWFPETRVTLIESNHKKVTFLREVIRALTLTAIDVFPGRAEDFPAATAAIVTLRAVERFDSILPIALGLLAPQGRLALLIGQSQITRTQTTAPALQWSNPKPIPQSDNRVLVIGRSHPQCSQEEPKI